MPQRRIARDWYKSQTADLDEPWFLALNIEQRGALDSILKYQARTSSVQGFFLSPSADPLTPSFVASKVHEDAGEQAKVFDAIAVFLERGILTVDEWGAIEKPDWLERYSVESQQAAIREGNAERQRRCRARKRQAEEAEAAARKATGKISSIDDARAKGGDGA